VTADNGIKLIISICFVIAVLAVHLTGARPDAAVAVAAAKRAGAQRRYFLQTGEHTAAGLLSFD
jgi:hypothetical protein